MFQIGMFNVKMTVLLNLYTVFSVTQVKKKIALCICLDLENIIIGCNLMNKQGKVDLKTWEMKNNKNIQ